MSFATRQEVEDYTNYKKALSVLDNSRDVAEYERLTRITTTQRKEYRDLAVRIEGAREILEDIRKRYGAKPFKDSELRIRNQIEADRLAEEERGEREAARYAEERRREEERLIAIAPSTINSLIATNRTKITPITETISRAELEYNSVIGSTKPDTLTRLIETIRTLKRSIDTNMTELESQRARSDNRTTAISAIETANRLNYSIESSLRSININFDSFMREKIVYEESIARPIIRELEIKKEKWARANKRFLETFETNAAYTRSWVLAYKPEQGAAKTVLDAAKKDYDDYYDANRLKLRPADITVLNKSVVKAEIDTFTASADCAVLYAARRALVVGVETEINARRASGQTSITALRETISSLEGQLAAMLKEVNDIDEELKIKTIPASRRIAISDKKTALNPRITTTRRQIEARRGELETLERALSTEIETLSRRLEGGFKYLNNEKLLRQKYLKYKAKYLKLKSL